MFKLSDLIKTDLFRYSGSTGFVAFLKTLKYPGFQFLFFFRKIQNTNRKSPFWWINRFFVHQLSNKYGFQIPYITKIGEGFYIGHFGYIVINGRTEIGRNCNIAPGVVIGQANRGKSKGVPKIGDRVWIGAGAVIVGNITIGNNVLIAPNSYLNISVPNNSIVVGNPAVFHENLNATQDYIENEV